MTTRNTQKPNLISQFSRKAYLGIALMGFWLLSACTTVPTSTAPQAHQQGSGIENIQTVVVIYGENRSFNNLYGLFPGARGIEDALKNKAYLQTDHDGSVLAALPPVWKTGNTPDTAWPSSLANAPFRIDAAPMNFPLQVPTRDLVHRFYQHQEQLNQGKNDRFAAVSDAGGLAMGYYDGSKLPLWKFAQEYTLADHFFMGAFGGSFLNHFWLICACTPVFQDAPAAMRAQLDPQGRLLRKPGSPTKAQEGPPQLLDGAVTSDGYAVNTVQPPFQPSGAIPDATNPALADASKNPLPPQTIKTIGDTLSAKGISWKWYAGGWQQALADRGQIYAGAVNFQAHHQPFNYFTRFAPGSSDRSNFLKDEQDLLADIRQGTLPSVVFYKPQGSLNEHPGYTDVLSGDQHIAELIRQLQASPQWKNMAIIVTYDENGGFWDHVAPPKVDRWGPGSRIPTLIISPFAKRGYIDHTPYDTTSILQFLTKRFQLEPLPGVRKQFGDLTNAFAFATQKP